MTALFVKSAMLANRPEVRLWRATVDVYRGDAKLIGELASGVAYILPMGYPATMVELGVTMALLAALEHREMDVAAVLRDLRVQPSAALDFSTERYIRVARATRRLALPFMTDDIRSHKAGECEAARAYLRQSIQRAWKTTAHSVYTGEYSSTAGQSRTVFE